MNPKENQTPNMEKEKTTTTITPTETPVPEDKKPISDKGSSLMAPDRKQEESEKRSSTVMIIVFIILGIAIFGLPYITDYIEGKKQEEKQPTQTPTPTPIATPTPTPTPETLTLTTNTCTEALIDLGTHTSQKQYILESQDDKIKKVTVITTQNYQTEDESYLQMQTTCQDNSLKYVLNPGYEVSCEVQNLTILTTEVFELEIFQPIIEEDKTIQAPFNLDQSVEEAIITFTANQTVCQ